MIREGASAKRIARDHGPSECRRVTEYRYIGPDAVRERSKGQPSGARIDSRAALLAWLREQGVTRGSITCTFVVTTAGWLRLADRHSEHVACSGGEPVGSAGELTLRWVGAALELEAISNLSTGFCPEPASWPVVAVALARAELAAPESWTSAYEFRRCTACGERNVIKDGWYACEVCDAPLPERWNFATDSAPARPQ